MTPHSSDQNWTYPSIRQALTDHKILLRVHTSPNSPLPSLHNDPSTSGFTARNAAFRGLAPQEFRQVTARLRNEVGWAEGPYMRKTIIDHLNNSTTARPRLSSTLNGHRGGRIPAVRPITQSRFEADEQSPWISTTQKLDWAIWYISKLLAQGRHGKVHLAIIKNGARHGEISVKPFRMFERYPNQPMGLEGVSTEAYRRARNNAMISQEILLYGRIFGESIISDLTITPYELPFALPLQFWNPVEQADPSRQGWLARLRFHPLLLNFGMSMDNVNRPPPPRGRGSWSMQPVNPNLQHHAHKVITVDPHLQIRAGGPPSQARTHHDHPRVTRPSTPAVNQPGHTRPEEEGVEEDEEEEEYTSAIEGMLVDLTIPDLEG